MIVCNLLFIAKDYKNVLMHEKLGTKMFLTLYYVFALFNENNKGLLCIECFLFTNENCGCSKSSKNKNIFLVKELHPNTIV